MSENKKGEYEEIASPEAVSQAGLEKQCCHAHKGVVTFLPRLLPLLMLRNRKLPHLLRRLLRVIPFAALGALIFPGMLDAVPSLPASAFAGMAAAVLVSWFGGGLMLSVVSSVGAVFLILLLAL